MKPRINLEVWNTWVTRNWCWEPKLVLWENSKCSSLLSLSLNSVPSLPLHFLSISHLFPLFIHPLYYLYTNTFSFIFYCACIKIFWLCVVFHMIVAKWMQKKELNSQGSGIACGFELQCRCWRSNLGLLEKHPESLTAVIRLQIPT